MRQTRSVVVVGAANWNCSGMHVVLVAHIRKAGSVGVAPPSWFETSNVVTDGQPTVVLLTEHRLTSSGDAETAAAADPGITHSGMVSGSDRHRRLNRPCPMPMVQPYASHVSKHAGVGSQSAK
jgi:hypothetical protein